MQVYAGAPYQRGYGLGRVMKNVIRQATPLLKHAGKQALKKGISALASGIMGGRKRKVRVGERKGLSNLVRTIIGGRKRKARVVGRRRTGTIKQRLVPSRLGFKPQTGSSKVLRKQKHKRDVFSL